MKTWLTGLPISRIAWVSVALLVVLVAVTGAGKLTIPFWDWLRSGGDAPIESNGTSLRNFALLLAGGLTLPLALWRSWVAERQTPSREYGRISWDGWKRSPTSPPGQYWIGCAPTITVRRRPLANPAARSDRQTRKAAAGLGRNNSASVERAFLWPLHGSCGVAIRYKSVNPGRVASPDAAVSCSQCCQKCAHFFRPAVRQF